MNVEHKNGDPMDNRRDNLEFLCPNCHTQTETYAAIKKIRGRGGIGRRKGLNGSIIEKLVMKYAPKFGEPCKMATPSQASKEEGVETRQELPKAEIAKAKA